MSMSSNGMSGANSATMARAQRAQTELARQRSLNSVMGDRVALAGLPGALSGKVRGYPKGAGASKAGAATKKAAGEQTTNGRTSGSRARGASGTHRLTAAERSAQGLAAEVAPGTPLTSARMTYVLNPWEPPSATLARLPQQYGEHQLGAALSRYEPSQIRAMAKAAGVSAGRSTAQAISNIVAHVTQGRYSADFPKASGSTGKSSSGSAKKAAAQSESAQLRAQLAAAQAENAALKAAQSSSGGRGGARSGSNANGQKRAASTASTAPTATTRQQRVPNANSALRAISVPGEPWDPRKIWDAFGGTRAAVQAALTNEPAGTLRFVAGQSNMPGTHNSRLTSATTLAKEIATRLDAAYGTGETPSGSKRGGGGAPAPVPIRYGTPESYNAYAPFDPYHLNYMYGHAQMQSVLSRGTARDLQQAVGYVQSRNPGTAPRSKSGKQAMIDYIMQYMNPNE